MCAASRSWNRARGWILFQKESALPTPLILAQWSPFQTSDLQNSNTFVYFKALNLCNFLHHPQQKLKRLIWKKKILRNTFLLMLPEGLLSYTGPGTRWELANRSQGAICFLPIHRRHGERPQRLAHTHSELASQPDESAPLHRLETEAGGQAWKPARGQAANEPQSWKWFTSRQLGSGLNILLCCPGLLLDSLILLFAN